jgi:hypothetical protein
MLACPFTTDAMPMNTPFSVNVTVPPGADPETFTVKAIPVLVTSTVGLGIERATALCPGAVTVCCSRFPASSYP